MLRLRHLGRDIDLPAGEVLLGRGSECDLPLIDTLASRRHAVLKVGSEVTVTDLGSRNGTLVNNEPVLSPRVLREGDQIQIGEQTLLIVAISTSGETTADEDDLSRTAERPTVSPPMLNAIPPPSTKRGPFGVPIHEGTARPSPGRGSPPHGTPQIPMAPTPAFGLRMPWRKTGTSQTMTITELREDDPAEVTVGRSARTPLPPPEAPGRSDPFGMAAMLAEKALALGRTDEAERLLTRPLTDLLQVAGLGRLDHEIAERAALWAARIAGATGKGEWVSYVLDLYTREDQLMPARLVDELFNVVRKVKNPQVAALRSYTAYWKEKSKLPTERFVVQRLEGLCQLGALR